MPKHELRTQINPHLTFNGNCREAMTFYQECIGGELKFQTVGASPLSTELSAPMKALIVHATLSQDDWTLMGSDMVAEQGLIKGNAVALSLQCNNEQNLKACYAKLAEGGTASHQLERNACGTLLGNLKDKFGNHWILIFDKTTKKNNNEKLN